MAVFKKTKNKIIVLGCGRVGSLIAEDLSHSKNYNEYESYGDRVSVVDSSIKNLNACQFIANRVLSEINPSTIPRLVEGFDIVVSAVPGRIGFEVAKAVLESKKNLIDISFFPEDAYELESLAKENGVLAAFDCGIAPGFSNMILGEMERRHDVLRYTCYVGGLPLERILPFEYKAGFSPSDVIEEYTRPARFIENGEIVEKSALTDLELINFDGLGTLEAFNSDGLRTMLKGRKCQNIKEKTMRFPGHAKLMEIFRETGLFNKEPITFMSNGKEVSCSPLDLTSKLLFEKWEFKPLEKDTTVLRSITETEEAIFTLDLSDTFTDNNTSMARTTGFTCTAVVRAFDQGLLPSTFLTPEEIGEKCFDFIVRQLNERDIFIRSKTVDKKTK